MAKKQLTPEEYKAKLEKKADKSKRFGTAFVKAFALFLACAIVFCASNIAFTRVSLANGTTSTAGGNTQNTGNTSNNGNDGVDWGDNTTPGDDVQTPADDNNGDPSNDGQPSGGDQTPSTPDNGNQGSGNQGDNGSGGNNTATTDKTQEAIDLYKTAMAKVKSSAKTVTHTKGGATNYKGIVEAGKLSSAASTLMGLFMKEEEPNEVIDKAELPPKGGASKLTKATVKSAAVKEEGNYQVVRIVMKDAVNPVAGADGIGSVANIIEESQITGAVGSVPGLSVSNISIAYENVTMTCKIEKSTGNMVYLLVDAPCILSLSAKLAIVSVNNAKVGIESKDEYTIAF